MATQTFWVNTKKGKGKVEAVFEAEGTGSRVRLLIRAQEPVTEFLLRYLRKELELLSIDVRFSVSA